MTSSSEDTVGEFRYLRHDASLPALRAGVDPSACRVAIVGGGPVGLALALGLARLGVTGVVIEADDTVCIGSRAACISRRSLEIIDRLGALPSFIAKGLGWTGGRSFFKTREVFRFEMPHDALQRLPPMINLQQYYIEQYLVDAVEELNRSGTAAPIDLRWASEVTALDPHDDGVGLRIRTPIGDYAMRADWLVACDGGQSMVRKSLDLPLVGTAYEGRYVIIDIHLPSTHPTERRAWFDPPWNPGSTVLMHRQADDIWRIDYQLRAGDDTATALEPDNVRRFVRKHLEAIGEGHLPWRTIWTSVYRAGAMTLESYRHGRVLFAGNAAHALPIFGVRGLNSGFDDADNLAWKLALVVQGKADRVLLDSYSQERVGAFHINAANAMRSTEFMSPPSRGFDLLREAALSLAAEHRDVASLVNPRQTEAVAYRDSPLSTPDETGLPRAAPGVLLPDFPLQDPEGHLTQWLGPWFTLLAFSRTGSLNPDAMKSVDTVAARAKVELQCLMLCLPGSPADGTWRRAVASEQVFEAHCPDRHALYLLRPDRHVAARWKVEHLENGAALAAPLDAALRRACGAAPVAGDHLMEKQS